DKPMILLLDDYNRASLQLAQAIMELIETGGYISWNLPKGSTVILTSNPEDEDYIVTSTDEAQKTRYMTYKMKFSIKEWVDNFAEKLQLPSICINFVLQHPEIFEFAEKIENEKVDDDENTSNELTFSKKTNIRIWTKFFLLLKNVKNI